MATPAASNTPATADATAGVTSTNDSPSASITIKVMHDAEECSGCSEAGPNPNPGEDDHPNDYYHYPTPDEPCEGIDTKVDVSDMTAEDFFELLDDLVAEHKDQSHSYEPLIVEIYSVSIAWKQGQAEVFPSEKDYQENVFRLLQVSGSKATITVLYTLRGC